MPRTAIPRLTVQRLEDRATPATLVALTADSRLWTFDSADPTKVASVRVSGLAAKEKLVGLDARPADGKLYAPSSQGRLYTLNPTTGVATAVNTTPAAILPKGGPYGFDFNPTVDRARFVSATGQNLRLNPNDGTVVDGDGVADGVQPDATLAFATGDTNFGKKPTVSSAAYTNNFLGATATTLYGLDYTRDALVRIGGVDGPPSPNLGEVNTVGSLGVNIGWAASFDIAPDRTAYAAVRTGNGTGPTRLATVDLDTGRTTLLGQIGTGRILDGLTVLPRDEVAYAVTAGNKLVTFRVDDPGTLLSSAAISGLTVGENILGIDVRPATGELFALTDTNRVLRLNPATAQGVQVGATMDAALFAAGVAGGFDFNPQADRLRLVNVNDENVRFDPVTFAVVDADPATPGVQTDTDLTYPTGDPNVVAAAYDRNDNDAATPTTLFGIDSTLNRLVRQGDVDGTPASPNAGSLTPIGDLGVDPTDEVGFDIAGAGAGGVGAALAVMQLQGETASKLFAVNLATGGVTLVGTVGGGEVIKGFAIAPPRIGFGGANLTVSEKAGNAVIVLTRTGGAYGAATVRLSITPGSATAGADFSAVVNQDVTFAVGETRKVILVPILQDKVKEPNETVMLSLSALSGGGNVVLDAASAVLMIVDDDGGASTGI